MWYHYGIENSMFILLDLLIIILKGGSNSNRINHAFCHHNQILFRRQEEKTMTSLNCKMMFNFVLRLIIT